MTSGNKMLSSKDGLGVWLHDQLSTRNKFYGNPAAKSSITVSANQDPSAVKMYKSLSLETNTKDWTAEVCTNVEYEGKEKQKGSISSFEKKEGFQYAEMPRDVLNSTRNIVGKPFTVSSLTEEYGSTDAFAIGSNFASELYGGNYVNPQGLTLFPVIAEEGFIPEDYAYSKTLNVSLYNVQNGSLLELFDVPGSVDYPQNNADPLALYVLGYQKYEGKVLLMLAYKTVSINSLGESPFQNNIFFAEGTVLYNNQLVFAVKPEIDGDQLRGPYANVEISTQTDKHAEIHAINVDYEFSKLDKRLTQNT
tara:strand:- start:354 stop:1274 length:921 start_codon:yes stop_codon:yes gene_type:complete